MRAKQCLLLWTAFLITACASTPKIADPYIAENAPQDCSFQTHDFDLYEVIEAMSPMALKGWPEAKARYLSGLPDKHSLFITMYLVDERGNTEYVFLAVDRLEGNEIYGRLWSQIGSVDGYSYGDKLKIKDNQIKDWLITKPDGSEEGNLIGKHMDTLNRCEHESV